MTKKRYSDGIHLISGDEYHASEGISRSALRTFMKSPYHYWYNYLSPDAPEDKETPAKVFGNLFHTMLLEPHLYEQNYIVQPKIDRRTKQGKIDYEEFMQTANGKIVITEDQFQMASEMAFAIRKNKLAEQLIQNAKYENSIYWTHQSTGVQCKARPDIWHPAMVVDIKTIADGCYRSFQSSAYKHGYYLQAGMTYEACKAIGEPIKQFIFIANEKEKPYPLAIYRLDDEGIEYGIGQYHAYMERIARCMEKNEWPDYGVQNLSIPRYAEYELDEA